MDHLTIPQHTTIVAHLHQTSSHERLTDLIDRTARQRSSTRERSAIRSKAREAAKQSDSHARDSWLAELSMSRTVWTAVLLLLSAIVLVRQSQD